MHLKNPLQEKNPTHVMLTWMTKEDMSWWSARLLQAHPIHLWDACTGSLRCVYRAYDAADEITAAYSVAMDRQGQRIWAGYNKAIRVFDLSRPGKDCQTITTFQKGQDGQPGMHCPFALWLSAKVNAFFDQIL